MKLLGVVRDKGRIILRYNPRTGAGYSAHAHIIELHWCWYDFWVGAFWDSKKRALYLRPLPMFAIRIQFGGPRT